VKLLSGTDAKCHSGLGIGTVDILLCRMFVTAVVLCCVALTCGVVMVD
jgi:hypothetical protein